MKKYIILIVITAAAFTGCSTTKTASSPDTDQCRISWNAFCAARGYDTDTKDEQVINEFLDTWVGSVVEEEALTRQGVEV